MEAKTETQPAPKIQYTIVPAEITDDKSSRGRKRNNYKRSKFYRDQEPKKVDGGYLINGVFYPNYEDEKIYQSLKEHIKAQLDLCFSEESLENNLFLRKYMDQEGYLPVTILCYIPAIQIYTIDPNVLMEILKTMPQFTVDEKNGFFRLKENWEKWLVENEDGTKGAPKYNRKPSKKNH